MSHEDDDAVDTHGRRWCNCDNRLDEAPAPSRSSGATSSSMYFDISRHTWLHVIGMGSCLFELATTQYAAVPKDRLKAVECQRIGPDRPLCSKPRRVVVPDKYARDAQAWLTHGEIIYQAAVQHPKTRLTNMGAASLRASTENKRVGESGM